MSGQLPSDPAARPRPRYGEYATPQEQAAIIARSMPPVSPVLVPAAAPKSGAVPPDSAWPPPADGTPSSPAPVAPASASPSPGSAAARSATRRRTWDLVLSVGLLLWGLTNVLTGFAQYSDLPALIDQVYATQSIGDYAATSLTSTIGTLVIVCNVVLWTLAAWITTRRLIAGRLAFWVPLIAGVVATTVSLIAVGVLIGSDPVFQQYVAG